MTARDLVLLAVAASALLAAQAVFYLIVFLGQRRRSELRRRLLSIGRPGQTTPLLLREGRFSRSPLLARMLEPLPPAQRLERLLEQTELPWTVASTIALIGLSAAAVFSLAYFLLDQPLIIALLCLPAGGAVPIVIVLDARARRASRVTLQLPDALDMMVRSLKAGHGINSALKLVAEEMPAPVAVEFGRLFEEQKFGVPLREAVTHLTERVPGSADLRMLAVAILLQGEIGGNLVENLEHIALTVRERFRFYGRLKTLTAEGRMSGWVLGCLPFVCLALLWILNPTYLQPLFADPVGRRMAASALGLWALGVLWIRRLINVDY